MRALFLCAGIGGFELAAEATGHIEIAGQVEIEPFCQRVLAHQFPGVPQMSDIQKVQGDEFGAINLVCAGFPCQPTSHAGKRRGASDDRWLWPDVWRIIQRARPDWVLLENVSGLLSLGLAAILNDLAGKSGQVTHGQGPAHTPRYEAQTLVFTAQSVGAPHERERVFIIARRIDEPGQLEAVAYANSDGQPQPGGRVTQSGQWTSNGRETVADTSSRGVRRRGAPRDTGQPTQRGASVEHTGRTGRQKRDVAPIASLAGYVAGRFDTRGPERGDAKPGVGRALDGISPRLARYPGWPAAPGETQRAYEPPRTIPRTRTRDNRGAKLKALGNALVPWQIYPVLWAITQTWIAAQQAQEVA